MKYEGKITVIDKERKRIMGTNKQPDKLVFVA